jgi:SAM-dependent methyltransferase
VSWSNPGVKAILPVIDILERPVLRHKGLQHLPPFSIRARSTGVRHQFGGGIFADPERSLRGMKELTDLQPTDHVLDVGCGAGRMAFALAPYLEYGHYTGIDVDLRQVSACQTNSTLSAAGCRFLHVDLKSDVYNPEASAAASSLEFPFPDRSFDVVQMISVITHMLSDDVAHYASEIVRILRPGGRVFVTFYGKDEAVTTGTRRFDYCADAHAWVEHPSTPFKAMAYEPATLDRWFGLPRKHHVLGSWRDGLPSDSLQDVVVYEAP